MSELTEHEIVVNREAGFFQIGDKRVYGASMARLIADILDGNCEQPCMLWASGGWNE